MESLRIDPGVYERLQRLFFAFNEETAQASLNAIFNEFGVQKAVMGFTYYSFGVIYSHCADPITSFIVRNLQVLFEQQECLGPISMALEFIYREHGLEAHIDPVRMSSLFPAHYQTSYVIIHSYALCLTHGDELVDLGNKRLWSAVSSMVGPGNQPDIAQVYSLSYMATCCVADYAGRLLRTANVQTPQLAAFIGALIGTTTQHLQQLQQARQAQQAQQAARTGARGYGMADVDHQSSQYSQTSSPTSRGERSQMGPGTAAAMGANPGMSMGMNMSTGVGMGMNVGIGSNMGVNGGIGMGLGMGVDVAIEPGMGMGIDNRIDLGVNNIGINMNSSQTVLSSTPSPSSVSSQQRQMTQIQIQPQSQPTSQSQSQQSSQPQSPRQQQQQQHPHQVSSSPQAIMSGSTPNSINQNNSMNQGNVGSGINTGSLSQNLDTGLSMSVGASMSNSISPQSGRNGNGEANRDFSVENGTNNVPRYGQQQSVAYSNAIGAGLGGNANGNISQNSGAPHNLMQLQKGYQGYIQSEHGNLMPSGIGISNGGSIPMHAQGMGNQPPYYRQQAVRSNTLNIGVGANAGIEMMPGMGMGMGIGVGMGMSVGTSARSGPGMGIVADMNMGMGATQMTPYDRNSQIQNYQRMQQVSGEVAGYQMINGRAIPVDRRNTAAYPKDMQGLNYNSDNLPYSRIIEKRYDENPRMSILKALCMFGPELTTDIDIFSESIGIISNEYTNFNNSISASMIGKCVTMMINSSLKKMLSTTCPEKPKPQTIQLRDAAVIVNPLTFASTKEDVLKGLRGEEYHKIEAGNYIHNWDLKTFFGVVTKAYNDLANLYESNPKTRSTRVEFSSLEFFRELDCPKAIMTNEIMIQVINFLTGMKVSLENKCSPDSTFNIPLSYIFSHWDNPISQQSVLFTVLAVSKKTTDKLLEYFELSISILNGTVDNNMMTNNGIKGLNSGAPPSPSQIQNNQQMLYQLQQQQQQQRGAGAGVLGLNSPASVIGYQGAGVSTRKNIHIPSLTKINTDLETVGLYMSVINWNYTPLSTPSIYRLGATSIPVSVAHILQYLIDFYHPSTQYRKNIMTWTMGTECTGEVANIANENALIYLRTHSYIFECTDFVITMFYLYHRFIVSIKTSGYMNKKYGARVRDIIEFFSLYSNESACQLITTMYNITRIANSPNFQERIVSMYDRKAKEVCSLSEVFSVQENEVNDQYEDSSDVESDDIDDNALGLSSGNYGSTGSTEFGTTSNRQAFNDPCLTLRSVLGQMLTNEDFATGEKLPSAGMLFLEISHSIMHTLLHDKKQYYKHIFEVLLEYNRDLLLLNFLKVYTDQSPDLITRQLDILTENRDILAAVEKNIRMRIIKTDKGVNLSPNLFQLDLAVIASGRSHVNIMIHIVSAICKKGARFVAALLEYIARKIITIIDHSDSSNADIEQLKKRPAVVLIRDLILTPKKSSAKDIANGDASLLSDSKRELMYGVSHTNINDTTILHILTTLDAFFPLVDVQSAVIPLKNGSILTGKMVLNLLNALNLNMRQTFDLESILAVDQAERESRDGTILVDGVKISMETVKKNAQILLGDILTAMNRSSGGNTGSVPRANAENSTERPSEFDRVIENLKLMYKSDNKSRILIYTIIEQLIMCVMKPESFVEEFPMVCTCLGKLINRDIIREHYLGSILNIVIFMLSSRDKVLYSGGLLVVHGMLDEPNDRIRKMRAVLSVLLETRGIKNDPVLSARIDSFLRSGKAGRSSKSKFIPDSFKYTSVSTPSKLNKPKHDWRLMGILPEQEMKNLNFIFNNITNSNVRNISLKIIRLLHDHPINLVMSILMRAKRPAKEYAKLILILDENQAQNAIATRSANDEDPFVVTFMETLHEQILVFFARLIVYKYNGNELSCIEFLKAVHLESYARYRSPLLMETDKDIFHYDAKSEKDSNVYFNRNNGRNSAPGSTISSNDRLGRYSSLSKNDLLISHGIQPVMTNMTEDAISDMSELLGIFTGLMIVMSSRCSRYSDTERKNKINASVAELLRFDMAIFIKELINKKQTAIIRYMVGYLGEYLFNMSTSLYKVASNSSGKYGYENSIIFKIMVGGELEEYDQTTKPKPGDYTRVDEYLMERLLQLQKMMCSSNYYLVLVSLFNILCAKSQSTSDYFDVIIESILKYVQDSLDKAVRAKTLKKNKTLLDSAIQKSEEQRIEMMSKVKEITDELTTKFIQTNPTHIPAIQLGAVGFIPISSHTPRSHAQSTNGGFSSSRESSDVDVDTYGQYSSRANQEEGETVIRFAKPSSRSNSTVPEKAPIDIVQNASNVDETKSHGRSQSMELSLSISNVGDDSTSFDGIPMEHAEYEGPFLFPIGGEVPTEFLEDSESSGISNSTHNNNLGQESRKIGSDDSTTLVINSVVVSSPAVESTAATATGAHKPTNYTNYQESYGEQNGDTDGEEDNNNEATSTISGDIIIASNDGKKVEDVNVKAIDEITVPVLVDINEILSNPAQYDALAIIGQDLEDETLFTSQELKMQSSIISRLVITDKMIPVNIKRLLNLIPPKGMDGDVQAARNGGNSSQMLYTAQQQQHQQQNAQFGEGKNYKEELGYLTKEQIFSMFINTVIYDNTPEVNSLIFNIVKINTALDRVGSSVIALIYEATKNVIDKYAKVLFNQMLIIGSYRLRTLGYDIYDSVIVPKEYIVLLNMFIVKQIYFAYGFYFSRTNPYNANQTRTIDLPSVQTMFVLVLLVQWSISTRLELLRKEAEYSLISNYYNDSDSIAVKELPKFTTVNGYSVETCLVKYVAVQNQKKNNAIKKLEPNPNSNILNDDVSYCVYKFDSVEAYGSFLVHNIFVDEPKAFDCIKCTCHTNLVYKSLSFLYGINGTNNSGNKNSTDGDPGKLKNDKTNQVAANTGNGGSSVLSNNGASDACDVEKQQAQVGKNNRQNRGGTTAASTKLLCLRCTGFQHVLDVDLFSVCKNKLEELITKNKARSPDGVLELNALNIDEIMNNTKNLVEETIQTEIGKRIIEYQKACGGGFPLVCAVALAVGNGGQYAAPTYINTVYISEPCYTLPVALERLVASYNNKQDIQALIQIILNVITHSVPQNDSKEGSGKQTKISQQQQQQQQQQQGFPYTLPVPSSPLSSTTRSHDNNGNTENDGGHITAFTPCVVPLLTLPHSSLCRILGCLIRGLKDLSKYRRQITKIIGGALREMAFNYPETDVPTKAAMNNMRGDEYNYVLENEYPMQFINTETLTNLSKEGLLITSEIFRQLKSGLGGETDILNSVSWNGMNSVFRCAAHLVCNSEDCSDLSSSAASGNGVGSNSTIRSYVQKDSNEQYVSIRRLTDLVDIIRIYYSALLKARKDSVSELDELDGLDRMAIKLEGNGPAEADGKPYTMIPESLSICMQCLTILDRLEKCCKTPSGKKTSQSNINRQKVRNLALLFWEVSSIQPSRLLMPIANRILTRIFSISLSGNSHVPTRVGMYKQLSECIAEMLRPMFIAVRSSGKQNNEIHSDNGIGHENGIVGNGGNGGSGMDSINGLNGDQNRDDGDYMRNLKPGAPEELLSTSGVGTIPELLLGIRRMEGFICGVIAIAASNTYRDPIMEMIAKSLCNYMKSNRSRNMLRVSFTDEELLIIHNSFSQFVYGEEFSRKVNVSVEQIRESFANYIPYLYNTVFQLGCYTATVAGNMIIGIATGSQILAQKCSHFPPSPTLACYLLTRVCVSLSTMTDLRCEESCGMLIDKKRALSIYNGATRQNNLLPLTLVFIMLKRLSPRKYPSLIHAHMIISTTSNVVNQSINFRYHKFRLFQLWTSIISDICATLILVHDLRMPEHLAEHSIKSSDATMDSRQHTDISTLVYIRLFLLMSVTLHDNSILHSLIGSTLLIPFGPGGQIRNMLQVVSADYIKYEPTDDDAIYDKTGKTIMGPSDSPDNKQPGNTAPKNASGSKVGAKENATLVSRISAMIARKEPIIDTFIPEWEKDRSTSAAICGSYKCCMIKNGSIPLPPLWRLPEMYPEYNMLRKQCDIAMFDKKNTSNNIARLCDMVGKFTGQDDMRLVSFVITIHCISRCAPCAVFRFKKRLFDNNPTHLINLLGRLTTVMCHLCGNVSENSDNKGAEMGYYFAESMVCMLRNGLYSIPKYPSEQDIDVDCSDLQTIVCTDVLCRILDGKVGDVKEQTLNIARELCLRCALEREFSIGFHPSGLRDVIKFIGGKVKSNDGLGQFLAQYPNVYKALKKRIQS